MRAPQGKKDRDGREDRRREGTEERGWRTQRREDRDERGQTREDGGHRAEREGQRQEWTEDTEERGQRQDRERDVSWTTFVKKKKLNNTITFYTIIHSRILHITRFKNAHIHCAVLVQVKSMFYQGNTIIYYYTV